MTCTAKYPCPFPCCSCANALVQGHFHYGDDKGLPAGHESLKCLSSKLPRWVGDAYWDDKVSI